MTFKDVEDEINEFEKKIKEKDCSKECSKYINPEKYMKEVNEKIRRKRNGIAEEKRAMNYLAKLTEIELENKRRIELNAFHESVCKTESSSQKLISGALKRPLASEELFRLKKLKIDEVMKENEKKLKIQFAERMDEEREREIENQNGKYIYKVHPMVHLTRINQNLLAPLYSSEEYMHDFQE